MGAKYWDDQNRYSQQNNNSVEKILHGKFETCGTTALVNCYDAMKKVPLSPVKMGDGEMQPEDAIAIVMNNLPAYSRKLEEIRPSVWQDYPINEIPQYYPFFSELCLGLKGEFIMRMSLEILIDYLDKGCAIQACLRNPNHFICLKNYDMAGKFFYANDPWNGRDGIPGFNRKIPFSEVVDNFQLWFIVYFPD